MAHSYHPPTLVIPNFVDPKMDYLNILGIFFAAIAAVVLLCVVASPRGQKFAFTWMVVTGLIHCITEGYWVFNWKTIPAGSNFFDEVWKEYAKSDSRYMWGETTVLGIEGITAVSLSKGSLNLIFL